MKKRFLLIGPAIGLTTMLVVKAGSGMQAGPTNHTAATTRAVHSIVESPALDSILIRSCGDCHTNTMRSTGWYTRVPPFSTMLGRGAREGRKAVNFDQWSAYSAEQRRELLSASCDDAKSGRMPMSAYLKFRGDAKLSPRDVDVICGAAGK